MAWIHKESFDILQSLDDGLIQNNYFEVDDLIALPISILNQKGYTTVASCAGHPFPHVYNIDTEMFLTESVDFDDLLNEDDCKKSDGTVNFKFSTYKSRISFIEFENARIGTIDPPEGWVYDHSNQMLYTNYTRKSDPYIFFEQQLKKIRMLMYWCTKIPPGNMQKV